ncbi:unnamed protein product, partial [Effrenium voratum]
VFQKWQQKQQEFRQKQQKKAQEKAQKEAKKAQAAKLAEMKAAAEKAKKEAEKAEKDEEMEAKEEEEDVKEEEKEDKADEEEEEEEEDVDFEGIDIFGIDEVDDIGGGMPLYKDFGMEDWALMSLCFELQLMAHAFKKDCNDPDRKGMILEHLGFYFNRYYSKPLSPKNFGVESEAELVELAKDCVFFNKDK